MYDKVKHEIESERGADWRDSAACLVVDPELFFPVGSEKSKPGRDQIEKAKRVCAGCDVKEQCLQYALETNNNIGIWGGMSEDERRELKRRTARGLGQRAASDPGVY